MWILTELLCAQEILLFRHYPIFDRLHFQRLCRISSADTGSVTEVLISMIKAICKLYIQLGYIPTTIYIYMYIYGYKKRWKRWEWPGARELTKYGIHKT